MNASAIPHRAGPSRGPRALALLTCGVLLALNACKTTPPAEDRARPEAAATVAPPPVDAAAVQAPAGTPMQMRLNSTPPGATAYVDGKPIGTTPLSHTIYVTGASVEFTFKLPGYADATYAFVPQVAGEVHGRLQRSSDR